MIYDPRFILKDFTVKEITNPIKQEIDTLFKWKIQHEGMLRSFSAALNNKCEDVAYWIVLLESIANNMRKYSGLENQEINIGEYYVDGYGYGPSFMTNDPEEIEIKL